MNKPGTCLNRKQQLVHKSPQFSGPSGSRMKVMPKNQPFTLSFYFIKVSITNPQENSGPGGNRTHIFSLWSACYSLITRFNSPAPLSTTCWRMFAWNTERITRKPKSMSVFYTLHRSSTTHHQYGFTSTSLNLPNRHPSYFSQNFELV